MATPVAKHRIKNNMAASIWRQHQGGENMAAYQRIARAA